MFRPGLTSAALLLLAAVLGTATTIAAGTYNSTISIGDAMGDKDVEVIGFSVNRRDDDRLPAMQAHASKNGYKFKYVFDESQEIGRKLGATRTPEYFVFDKARKLVYTGQLNDGPVRLGKDGKKSYPDGEPKQNYVVAAVSATLAGKPVATPETRPHGCTVEYE